MENCLFVGGPNDGERAVVDIDQRWIRRYEPVAVDACVSFKAVNVAEKAKSTIYNREVLWSGDRRFYVYMADGMSAEDMIGRLINGYQPPAR